MDGANIEIAEEIGVNQVNVGFKKAMFFDWQKHENQVFFFGHLASAVEGIRYQHTYHPVSVEEKSTPLAAVLDEISGGRFGDSGDFEPWVFL